MGRQTIIQWTSGHPPLDWSNEVVAIVASGPSAQTIDLSLLLQPVKIIAINESWQLVPWADLLYGTDGAWWNHHRGVPQFTGRKMTSSSWAALKFKLDTVFCVGNNSGTRAIWLAQQLGARRILLIGYDMHLKDGVHWHAPHPIALRNPQTSQMTVWRLELERSRFAAEVINCTPNSALRCFPCLELKEAINGHDDVASRTDKPRYRVVS